MRKVVICQHCDVRIPAVRYDCPSDFDPKSPPRPLGQQESAFTAYDGEYVPIVPIVQVPYGWTSIANAVAESGRFGVDVMVQPSGRIHVKCGIYEVVIYESTLLPNESDEVDCGGL